MEPTGYQRRGSSGVWRAIAASVVGVWLASAGGAGTSFAQTTDETQFERHVRPVLVERCHKCHAGDNAKGGLRLDRRDAAVRGGDSGAAIVPGKPEESLLLLAVRHEGGLKMPPDGKLKAAEIDALADWIRRGAPWPGQATPPTPAAAATTLAPLPVPPNHAELASSLQLWLRADGLPLNDGDAVHVWPDHSGQGRDVAATKGVRDGGVGGPGRYVRQSTLLGRPAVRFDTATGFAASPGNPVPLRGDAELTIFLVVNLQPHEAQPPYDGIFAVGNPAHPGDPGRPLAALAQINRGEDHAFHFAGGWNHDASLGAGSFKPWYGKPLLLTIVKRPGPMRATTHIFLNGRPATGPDGKSLEGRDGVPDFQHRADIGVYLGKALAWCGSIQGDVGEAILYTRALSDSQRAGVEAHLSEKFGLWLDLEQNRASAAKFTDAERSYWAFQPVRDVRPPDVTRPDWALTPVDRFVLARLEADSRSPAAPASPLALLRRVTFDLTGLPPTPDEVDEWLADEAPDAYERLVDRLLASPHYGERWGRHWLDLARYAESTANDANAVMRYAWRYRNYVLDAWNADLPYDQFVTEQLAGDLLPKSGQASEDARRIIATGFLMVGPKALAETDKEQSRLDIVDDQIDVLGRSMLGLTLACARCHDHKFDAIRATDYYALAGILRSTEPFQDENRNASMWWEYEVPQGDGLPPLMVMAPKESTPRNLRVHLRGNRFTLGAVVPRGVPQILASLGDATSTNPARGAALAVASDSSAAHRHPWGAIDPAQMSSGRLELARWIASAKNSLTPRVLVNRLWQHHFGRGLSTTSDNFGTRGDRPTHPELLDWLAARLIDSGWSVKQSQRQIILSNTYRQAAARGADDVSAPRVALRRLTAEELRDAILAVSGRLDRAPGKQESGEFLHERAEGIGAKIRPNRVGADDPFYTQFAKRTVYLPVVRNMLPDVLALFDAADPNGVTTLRNETTVASQSLFLLNHPLVRAEARHFAERLARAAGDSAEQRVHVAHRLAFGRAPTSDELREALDYLARYESAPGAASRPAEERRGAAWQSYCQTLFCSNEFLYIE